MASGLVPNIVITFNISLISLDSGRPDLFQCRLFFRPFRLGFFTLFLLFLLHFHLVRGRNDFLHDPEFPCPEDEEDESSCHDGNPCPEAQVDDNESDAGEEGGQCVHDEDNLLLIEALGKEPVMQVVLIRRENRNAAALPADDCKKRIRDRHGKRNERNDQEAPFTIRTAAAAVFIDPMTETAAMM